MGEIQKSDINNLKDSIINCLRCQINCYSQVEKCKDDVLICIENQLKCYEDTRYFSRILSGLFNEKMSEVDKKMSEVDKKMSEIDDKIKNYLDYISLEREKEKIERNRISKVWWYLFFISFLCIVLYFAIL